MDATEVLRAMVAMFASGDPGEATSIVDPECVDHQGQDSEPLRGVEGFARVVRSNHSNFTSHQVTIEDIFGEGDRAVARIRWQGVRHDGESVDRQTIDIVKVCNGRAIEHWGAQTYSSRRREWRIR